MSDLLEDLAAKYKALVLSDQEKASIEHEVVQTGLSLGVTGKNAREWVCTFLGTDRYTYTARATLWNAGEAANPLWERVNAKQMLLSTATDLLRAAKQAVMKSSLTIDEGVRAAIEQYDARPYITWVNGIPLRKGAPRRRTSEELKKGPKKLPGPRRLPDDPDAAFVAELRAKVLEYVRKRLSHSPAVVADKIAREFTTNFRVVMDALRRNLREAVLEDATLALRAKVFKRGDIIDACYTLHIDPPPEDAPADVKQARANYVALARAYHPDANDGDETKRPKYEAVCSAYALLKKYNEHLAKKETPNGSTAAGGDSGG